MKRLRAALVTNVPAPYRVPMLQRVADRGDIELHAVYCAAPHIDTSLDAAAHGFATHWLGGRYLTGARRFMHSDLGVVGLLRGIRPDVVVTTGFIPTFLYAYAWSRWAGVPHVAMTDGTVASERGLSSVHRWLRRQVWARSSAFAGACEGSLDLFRAAGVAADRLFKVPLAVDNARFAAAPDQASMSPFPSDLASTSASHLHDFLFCGRLLPHKGPAFALDVAAATAERLGRRTSILFVGEGECLPSLRSRAATLAGTVDAVFVGHLSQSALPAHYAAARLFLFPSQWDPWGVVANEACASGVPVLVSPYAGAAGELVRDGHNGRVLQLQVQAWADAAVALLGDDVARRRMGAAGRESVRHYTFEIGADGLVNAIRRAVLGPA